MRPNIYKLLFFGLLLVGLGFFIGRATGGGCVKRHGHMACCDKDGNCEHGGTCCKPGGSCTKAGCDHAAMMEGHGCGHGNRHARNEADHEQIVKDLEAADFTGDTTIAIPGGHMEVSRGDGRTEVRVQVEEVAP